MEGLEAVSGAEAQEIVEGDRAVDTGQEVGLVGAEATLEELVERDGQAHGLPEVSDLSREAL